MYPPLRPEEQVTEGRRRRDTGTHPIIITARNKLERWRAEQFAHCTSGIVCCSQKDTKQSNQVVAPTQLPVCSKFLVHWIGGEIGATTVGPATRQQQTTKENTCDWPIIVFKFHGWLGVAGDTCHQLGGIETRVIRYWWDVDTYNWDKCNATQLASAQAKVAPVH